MPRWVHIEKELKAQAPIARMRAASAFWEDFRARVPLYPQAAPEATRAPALLRWSLATASTVLLLAGVAVYSLHPGSGVPGNAITALDIATPHRAVFIMNDAASGGTILWIDCDGAETTSKGDVL